MGFYQLCHPESGFFISGENEKPCKVIEDLFNKLYYRAYVDMYVPNEGISNYAIKEMKDAIHINFPDEGDQEQLENFKNAVEELKIKYSDDITLQYSLLDEIIKGFDRARAKGRARSKLYN
jgi:hypothetical protein